MKPGEFRHCLIQLPCPPLYRCENSGPKGHNLPRTQLHSRIQPGVPWRDLGPGRGQVTGPSQQVLGLDWLAPAPGGPSLPRDG